jgi:glutamine amidotransferase
MISVVDYGAGNLRSVVNALIQLGYSYRITQKPEDVLEADTVILPGVGAANDTMNSLKKLALIEPIKKYILKGRPFFGICIGLQILLSTTEEGGKQECLGIVPGRVQKLSTSAKVPHMGWNQVKQLSIHPIFTGIPDNTNFYFVHSYYAVPESNSTVIGTSNYGISFCSVLAQGKLVATQFHPEKSGEWGLKLFNNFLKMAEEKKR